jgi:hypothetical protein
MVCDRETLHVVKVEQFSDQQDCSRTHAFGQTRYMGLMLALKSQSSMPAAPIAPGKSGSELTIEEDI